VYGGFHIISFRILSCKFAAYNLGWPLKRVKFKKVYNMEWPQPCFHDLQRIMEFARLAAASAGSHDGPGKCGPKTGSGGRYCGSTNLWIL